MSGPENLSKVDRLRARDGDLCWLCASKLNFAAEPNSKKAPTIEHLDAISRGGSNDLANLVLCHPGCNKSLGNRPRKEKLLIRAKWQANRERIRAAQLVRAATPVEEGGNKRAVVTPKAKPAQAKSGTHVATLQRALSRWRWAAAGATGAALLASGVALGLLIRG
jgi:hypothetical protein